MTVSGPAMSQAQFLVLERTVRAIAEDKVAALGEELHELALADGRLWLPPPLLTVAAALMRLLVDAQDGPWEIDEDLWDGLGVDRRPSGRSQWRNANFAVHAAGCLAGGVWLDVGQQESYWQLPLWPFVLDLTELLSILAQQRLSLTPPQLAATVTASLSPLPSPTA